MKKFICGLSAIVLMSMSVTAYAAPASDPNAASLNTDGNWEVKQPDQVVTSVSYESSPSFIVEIPASVKFTSKKSQSYTTFAVVKDVTLPSGSIVSVSITDAANKTDDSKFNLVNGTDKIPYKIYTENEDLSTKELTIDDEVVSFFYDGDYDGIEDTDPAQIGGSDAEFKKKLSFYKPDSDEKFAGMYTDNVQFTVKVSYQLTITYQTSPTASTSVTVRFEEGDTWDKIMQKDEYKERFGIKQIDSTVFVTLDGRFLVIDNGNGYFDPVRPTDKLSLSYVYDARNYG